MADDTVFLTTHFVAPETISAGSPAGNSSALRFERLSQLTAPGSPGSLHGTLDVETMVRVLRDRVNPRTGEEAPAGTFDNDASLATNGALYAIVFDPGALRFWAAAGAAPVPEQPFVGFSLAELLGSSSCPAVTPPVIE
jgi:hypothetical protein